MQDTQARTDCKQKTFEFQGLERKKVVADFSGGHISSDGGELLLREMDRRMNLCAKLAGCFRDYRDHRYVEHELPVLVAQRVHAMALGYEDLNDHERLRTDPLLALGCGRSDLLGEERSSQSRGVPLAGKSTLNRLELGAAEEAGHYRKIQADPEKIESLLVETGVAAIPRKSRVIVLDFDATDDPLHGGQEGRFFHGYYRNYCYLPLYCFCGDIALWAELRTAKRDASEGTLEALEKILAAIRKRFGKHVVVVVRGDSGFCRDELMDWIEGRPNVHYCFGLARNKRLEKLLEPAFEKTLEELDYYDLCLAAAGAGACAAPQISDLDGSARNFAEFEYRTRTSWSRARRVIGKAEITNGKKNPRFIVTDIRGNEDWARGMECFSGPRELYEKFYCARGDMENRIKEQQLDLFADRTSTARMASNQLRLWFSTFAYMLVARLRAEALRGTVLARATAGSIRTRLLKIGARITVSVRRIHIRLAQAFPLAEVFARAHRRLCGEGYG